MHIETIALSKLVPSPANVRKAKSDIGGLAASIMAHGLLQNLQVCPNGGNYEVIAGGRRLAALKFLAKQKKIDADYAVACEVREGPDAVEISLAENEMREAMHPADQFDAFKKLADEGREPEDIAARFGTTPRIVEQRLKLAVVSPKLIAAYRAGQMSLDCLMAFTVSDDHKAQEKVWAARSKWGIDPGDIRDSLTEKHVEANSKLAKFVGIKAYERAGGAVLRDLFDDENAGWLTDPDLLQRLAMEKLVKAQAALTSEGWKWAEIMPDIDYSGLLKFVPLRTTRNSDHDEESFTGEQKAKSGCILAIGYDGKLEIHAGRLRPEDAKAERKAEAANKKGKTGADTGKQESGLPATMIEDLTTHRTAALMAKLAGNPKIALAAVTHVMALDVFYNGNLGNSALGLRASETILNGHAQGIEKTAAVDELAAAVKDVTKGMPKEEAKLWDWIMKQDQKTLLAILTVCAGSCVNAIQRKGAKPSKHAAQLAEALKLDMAHYWQPTAEGYFGRVSKDLILDAVRESIGKPAADNIAALKKDEMAKRAAALIKDKGWLPAILR